MHWNSLKFRIALFTSLSVSLLLVIFGWYNYSAARAASYQKQSLQVEQAIGRLQLSLPGPLWNYESAFIEASLKSELADEALLTLLVINKDKLVAGFDRSSTGKIEAVVQVPPDLASAYLGHDLVYDDGGEKSIVARLWVRTSDAGIQTQLRQLLITTIWQTLVLDLAIILLLMFLLHHHVLRPLAQMNMAVSDLARGEGDLTHRLLIRRRDEMGALAGNINQFIAKLQGTVLEINTLSAGVLQTAERCEGLAAETRHGSSEQQAELDQVATAITQMSHAVEEVAGNAIKTSAATDEANHYVEQGHQLAGEANQDIHQLVGEVERVAGLIQSLSTESSSIGNIIEVINGIAEQTNLLALNAAIEAARAGEQGRGFAVVADEVRTLSGRTRKSTEEISASIMRLQQASQNVVAGMKNSQDKAARAGVGAADVQRSVAQIKSQVSLIRDMNITIAQASEEQHAVASEVSSSINRIAILNSEGAARFASVAAASSNLRELSAQLDQLLKQFRV